MLSAGDILGKLIGFLILPYLTSQMGVSEYGLLTLYLSFIQILIILISFSGQGLLPVKYIQESKSAGLIFRRDNIKLSIYSAFVLLIFFMVLKLFINIKISYEDLFLIIFASLFQAINVINLAYFRISQTYLTASIGQFSLSALNVMLTVTIFVLLNGSANNRLLAVCISFLLIQLFYSLIVFSKIKVDFKARSMKRKDAYKEILFYGMSLWPHHGSYWIKSSIDRFFIAHYMSIAVVGVYGLALQLSSILMLLFSVINQALQPFIYRYLNEGNFKLVKKIQCFYVLVVLICAILSFFLMPVIFPYLFNPKFNGTVNYFNFLLPGTIFMCIYYVYTNVLFFYKKNKIISFITTSSMVIHLLGIFCVVLTVVSVKMFCLVYTISSAVACIAVFYFCRKQINIMKVAKNAL